MCNESKVPESTKFLSRDQQGFESRFILPSAVASGADRLGTIDLPFW